MEQALQQAAILTFEELGFMFPMEDAQDSVTGLAESSCVGVKFEGPFSGELVLRIEDDALTAVAANMLATDDMEPEMVQDVLGEIANVICGNALPEIGGKQAIFRLSAPASHYADPAKQPAATTNLSMDEGRASVSLYIN